MESHSEINSAKPLAPSYRWLCSRGNPSSHHTKRADPIAMISAHDQPVCEASASTPDLT